MSLISLVVTLAVIGLVLYLVNQYIPMEATIKKIINIVVIVCVCIWLLTVFNILPDMNAVRVGR